MRKFRHEPATRQAGPAQQQARITQAQPARLGSLPHLTLDAIVQRATAATHALRPAELIAMQRAFGNRATGAMLGQAPVQAKLIVNAPGDQYEREAERVAEQVTQMPAVGRQDAPGRQDRPPVTANPTRVAGGSPAGEDFEHRLQASHDRGRTLPPGVRETFETKFGVDFSAVRIHAGHKAGQLSQAIGAQAFTRGSDIYFGPGRSEADTKAGQHLLAHELTHVIQQGAAPPKAAAAPQRIIQAEVGAAAAGLFGTWNGSVEETRAAGVRDPELSRIAQPKAQGMIQRKITAGKLNLVGEDHDESRARRDSERDFFKEKFGFSEEQYWQEKLFRGRNDRWGNSKRLTVLQRASYMVKNMKYFSKSEHLSGGALEQVAPEMSEDFRKYQMALVNWTTPPTASADERAADEEFIREARVILGTVFRKDYDEAKRKINTLLRKNGIDQTKSIEAVVKSVSARRSSHMLSVAYTSGKIGVWKIGNDHLKDINEVHRHGGFDKIALTSAEEFNKEFKNWSDKKYAAYEIEVFLNMLRHGETKPSDPSYPVWSAKSLDKWYRRLSFLLLNLASSGATEKLAPVDAQLRAIERELSDRWREKHAS